MSSIEVRNVPRNRRLVIGSLKVGRDQIPVHGLIDVDVTRARERLKMFEPPLSMTAYVAAALHPEVHGYRNWRGQLVLHGQVDIATLIEVTTPTGTFPLAHLIVDTQSRSVADISTEIRKLQHDPGATHSQRMLNRV